MFGMGWPVSLRVFRVPAISRGGSARVRRS